MAADLIFIAGTDTNVGKTVITAALYRMLSERGEKAALFKPVQSGALWDQDSSTMIAPDCQIYKDAVRDLQYKGPIHKPRYNFPDPCSPHLAAEMASEEIDYDLLLSEIERISRGSGLLLMEGAGGLFTPLNRERNYMDLLAYLKPGVILTADNKLGMLNHTRLSIEMLESRGIEICGLVINHCRKGADPLSEKIAEDNIRYLSECYPEIKVISLPYLEELNSEPDPVLSATARQRSRAWKQLSSALSSLPLKRKHEDCTRDIQHRDKENIFHPYSSIKEPLKTYRVTGAKGNYIHTEEGRLLDGMSSWWCTVHGYNNKELNRAAIRQINDFSHVMFGGLRHDPATRLTDKLLEMVPGELDAVFYCDSGSVSVEVALKMALQYWQGKGVEGRTKILSFEGAYHGDTFAAMSVCDPLNGMHRLFSGFLPRQIFAPRPSSPFGSPFDPDSLKAVEELIKENRDSIAALILEPIVQGAGGMWIYHPDFLKGIKELCLRYDILLILDEIATGFGRTGKLFASQWASVSPDIMCVGKALTGGYLSFAAALCTRKVAQGLSDKGTVFMHGPTFMANPLACAIACRSLELLEQKNWKHSVKAIEKALKRGLAQCSNLDEVSDVRVLGAIGVVEIDRRIDVQSIQEFFVSRGVWIRPYNRVIYLMPPFHCSEGEIAVLCSAVFDSIKNKHYREKKCL